jgi:hypothetical protein
MLVGKNGLSFLKRQSLLGRKSPSFSVEAFFNFFHTNLARHFVWKILKNALNLEFFPCKNIPTSLSFGKNRFRKFT